MSIAEKIKIEIPGVKLDEPLKNHTTFQIGGPAKYFVAAKNRSDLLKSIKFACANKLDYFILGGGSNVLFLDDGFSGLVIKNETGEIGGQGSTVTVDSGYELHGLVRYACKEGLSGIQELSWIPGKVGGAIYGNAGAHGVNMANLVTEVEAYDCEAQQVKKFSNKECEFAYRSSIFKKQKELLILGATLKMSKGLSNELLDKCEGIKNTRKEKLPQQPSAGCVFKNVSWDEAEDNPELKAAAAPVSELPEIPAGLLVDQAGLKGKKVGGAMVSKKHANFIVNAGDATADDVLKLISLVKSRIRDKFGVELDCEIQIIK